MQFSEVVGQGQFLFLIISFTKSKRQTLTPNHLRYEILPDKSDFSLSSLLLPTARNLSVTEKKMYCSYRHSCHFFSLQKNSFQQRKKT